MKTLSIFFIFLLQPLFAWAIVDMRNANFSDTWTDMIVPNSGYELKIKRTYNSRTLFNGMFGFGWCSDLESTLVVTSDGHLSLTECGGGLEFIFKSKNSSESQTREVIQKIISKMKKEKKNLKDSYYRSLQRRLETDNGQREKLARQFGIKGTIGSKKRFYADGRRDEMIRVEKSFYVRTLPNDTYEKYDIRTGKLKYIYDKTGNYIKINHRNKKIVSVVDNNGNKLSFSYPRDSRLVSLITGPNKLSATYKHKGEDLVFVENAWGNKYTYKYDDLHNLIAIIFPDKTRKLISYNKDKDWVIGFTDRKGCKETYKYELNKKNPIDHYTSYVEKKCKKQITNTSSYEFLYKKNKDGTRYLARTRFENNGNITETIYHKVYGKPILSIKNDIKSKFHYYNVNHKFAGMLKQKIDLFQTTNFSYTDKCRKVSQVTSHYYQLTPPADLQKSVKGSKKPQRGKLKKKFVRTIKTRFYYNKIKCNLVSAKNSLGQTIHLSYDQKGRIKTIQDQAKKLVHIKYNERLGKPREISRPELGSIQIYYKSDGSIEKIKSKHGPTVISQTTSVFQNLLEVIAPAASELVI